MRVQYMILGGIDPDTIFHLCYLRKRETEMIHQLITCYDFLFIFQIISSSFVAYCGVSWVPLEKKWTRGSTGPFSVCVLTVEDASTYYYLVHLKKRNKRIYNST